MVCNALMAGHRRQALDAKAPLIGHRRSNAALSGIAIDQHQPDLRRWPLHAHPFSPQFSIVASAAC